MHNVVRANLIRGQKASLFALNETIMLPRLPSPERALTELEMTPGRKDYAGF